MKILALAICDTRKKKKYLDISLLAAGPPIMTVSNITYPPERNMTTAAVYRFSMCEAGVLGSL